MAKKHYVGLMCYAYDTDNTFSDDELFDEDDNLGMNRIQFSKITKAKQYVDLTDVMLLRETWLSDQDDYAVLIFLNNGTTVYTCEKLQDIQAKMESLQIATFTEL